MVLAIASAPSDASKALHQVALAMCCAHGATIGPTKSIDTPVAEVHEAPVAALHCSRRSRLWELPTELHCSIIGVCLPLDALRRLVAKQYGSPCLVGDYELHSVVVNACKTRTPLIELVQRELDRRYAGQIKYFQTAKTDAAVMTLWTGAVADGSSPNGLGGALWASLTHPRSDDALRTQIGHDIHMIQHQVGSEERRISKELAQVRQLNAEHLSAFEDARSKLFKLQAHHAQEVRSMQLQLSDVEAAWRGAKAQNEALRLQMESLRQSVTALDTREKLSRRVDELSGQNGRLKQQLAELAAKKPSAVDAAKAHSGPSKLEAAGIATIATIPGVINLQQKSVLCVGGRSSAVASYRKAVEGAGGKFIHHDGGIEHNHHRLDANLAAADCVVCQTGHISHTAYWLVKSYCKKTGKSCVYLDKPGVSTFLEGLGALLFARSRERTPGSNARCGITPIQSASL